MAIAAYMSPPCLAHDEKKATIATRRRSKPFARRVAVKKPKSDVLLDDRDFPMSLGRKCLFQATGFDIAEGRQKPIIAIANSQTDINPGHMHLDTIAQRVKDGGHAAGGLPVGLSGPAPRH